MKRTNRIILLAGIMAVVLASCPSCVKVEKTEPSGSTIRFGVSTMYSNGPATRTEYSGKDQENKDISVTSTAERIDWMPTDVIRILCDRAVLSTGSGHHADYNVTPSDSKTDQTHGASISPVSGELQWLDEGMYYFYALYPSPLQNSAAVLTSKEGNKATVNGVIPTEQSATLREHRLMPDMDYAYMYATKTAPQAANVTLDFKPLVTTIEFTLKRVASDDIDKNLTKVELSSASTPLTGDFTAELTETGLAAGGAAVPTYSAGVNDRITITLPQEAGQSVPGVKLTDDPLTVTFLTLPVSQTDLTLTLYFDADYSTKRTLQLKNNGAFIEVPARKKAYIRNLGVPGSIEWEYHLSDLDAVTVAYWGGDGSFADSFVSYKTNDGGATKTAVPFTLEYSEDGGTTWTTTAPSWLTSAPAPGTHAGGTAGESMPVTVEPQVNSTPDPHHDALVAKGSYATAKDLSTIDVSTGGTVTRTTANCYAVDRPGSYKFPLVYGNGVDWTKNTTTGINESAFRAKAGVAAATYRPDNGATYYLGRFKDHLDQNIMSPYIAIQQSGKAMSAVLVWQDVPGLVTVNPGISGSGENAYITFSVPEETITQGNALIAVLVDDDGDDTPETIAWSWHIWVTEEDLTAVKEGSNSNYLAPVNIGWCEGKTETYAARSCQVRATQAGSGLTRTATLTQTEGSVVTGGNSPYYHWGRKDPLQATNGKVNTNTFKTYYPSSSAYAPAIVPGPVSIGAAIRSPYTFYTKSSYPRDWCSTTYHNHWSSTINGTGTGQNANAKTKTVYDPSPVGFRVPAPDAWAGFNGSNFTWGAVGGDNGGTYGPSGLFFPASGYRSYSSGGMNNVGGFGRCWSSSPYSDRSGYTLSVHSGNVNPSNDNYRAYGFPVRCVKE